MTNYSLQWKITSSCQSAKLKDGGMVCDLVDSWNMGLSPTFTIVYPPAAHALQEDTDYYHMRTFAGILLGRSEYPPHPDIAELYWHLKQVPIAPNTIDEILRQYSFLDASALHVEDSVLNTAENVQLVALNFSSSSSIDAGEQRWLITTARTQQVIRDDKYGTPHSPHNGWLPWYDASLPEFFATYPHEVYRDTILAPLTQAEIFNRKLGQFLPEPIAVIQEMQDMHDLIEPLVREAEQGSAKLFTHMVLKKNNGFLWITLEILPTGQINIISQHDLFDTAQLKLPSAHMLGYAT